MGRNGNDRGERAERILEAADRLFCERGFDGVSMRDVARLAGVNKALTFYYFNSKAELFERVLERYYRAHMEALDGAFAESGPIGSIGSLHERIHAMMDAYLDFMVSNQRYARLIQQQVAGSETHHALIERNLAPLFRWTEGVLAEAAPATGHLSARQFFVTFSAMVINYFTYAPVLSAMWGEDPMSATALRERRRHLHWLVDVILDRLEAEEVDA
jgi:AcrR family transcriptional regulator